MENSNKMGSESKTSKYAVKLLMLFIPIAIIVGLNLCTNNIKKDNQEYFDNGGSEAVEMINNSDSIIIDNLTIKYPKSYKITDKYGNENMGGYALMCYQDELTFNYTSKKITGEQTSTVKFIDDEITKLETGLLIDINKIAKYPVKMEPIKNEKIGNFNVRVRRIDYNNNSLYIYGVESKNYYFRFTSHRKYFLRAIINGLN